MRTIRSVGTTAGVVLLMTSLSASPSFAAGTTAGAGFEAEPAVSAPIAGTAYIERAEWRWNTAGPGWTLSVYPTDALRRNHTYIGARYAWAELLRMHGDRLTENQDGMRDQFFCHVMYAYVKDTYNLDQWRPDVGLAATVAADCNPGAASTPSVRP